MKIAAMYMFVIAGLLFGGVAAIAQVQAKGGTQLWVKRYNAGDDLAQTLALDGAGNVFVTGSEDWSGEERRATVAYSSTGVPLWTNRFGPSLDSVGGGIAVDVSGNVFVAVVAATDTNYSNFDYATLAYSAAGVPLWTNRYGDPGGNWSVPSAIALDRSGNVFVTGWRGTVAYSNAGVPLWTNCCNSGSGVAVDSSGNVFVAGFERNSGDVELATVAYSGSGVPLWTNNCCNSGQIAVDGSGNVIVSGSGTVAYSSTGTLLWSNCAGGVIAVDRSGKVFVTGTSATNSTAPNYNYMTVALSSAGVALWTNYYDGPAKSDDFVNAIAADRAGNVFVTGSSTRTTSPYNLDYATVAYSNTGVPLWTNRYNGPANGNDGAAAMAVDPTGNVIVTGYSYNPNGPSSYATIKYSSSVPPVHLDFQRLNNQLVLTWTNAGVSLQSAPAVTGTFTNVPGATSPYTNSMTSAQQYFRLAMP